MKVKSEREVDQSCHTLSHPMDCSPPGSSVHGSFQARVLEWVVIAFSMDYRNIKDTHIQNYELLRELYGEGNGTPLQYSCLENPMDGGAWWAAVYGVAQSRTRLKRLSNSSSSITPLK